MTWLIPPQRAADYDFPGLEQEAPAGLEERWSELAIEVHALLKRIQTRKACTDPLIRSGMNTHDIRGLELLMGLSKALKATRQEAA